MWPLPACLYVLPLWRHLWCCGGCKACETDRSGDKEEGTAAEGENASLPARKNHAHNQGQPQRRVSRKSWEKGELIAMSCIVLNGVTGFLALHLYDCDNIIFTFPVIFILSEWFYSLFLICTSPTPVRVFFWAHTCTSVLVPTHTHANASHDRCCGFFQSRPFVAHWTAQSEFSELVMERSMLRDHAPYRVLGMLTRLQKQEGLLSVS